MLEDDLCNHNGTHDRALVGLDQGAVCGQMSIVDGFATICPGVTIGDNSIIATGAVVMTNVAPNSVVADNPVRKVRELAPIPAA